MTSNALIPIGDHSQDEDDMFFDVAPPSAFDVKKIELAAQLNALMVYSGKTRTEMSESLGCKKSRITQLLSGKNNYTFKTVWDFASKLNFDFDIVFRSHTDKRPLQPWQTASKTKSISNIDLRPQGPKLFHLQSAQEVALDMVSGRSKKFYISLLDMSNQMLPHQNFALSAPTNTLPLIAIPTINSEIKEKR